MTFKSSMRLAGPLGDECEGSHGSSRAARRRHCAACGAPLLAEGRPEVGPAHAGDTSPLHMPCREFSAAVATL